MTVHGWRQNYNRTTCTHLVTEMEVEDGNCVPLNTDSAISPQQPIQRQRLVITYIVNEFFKSYAGKQVLGPFHKVKFIVY